MSSKRVLYKPATADGCVSDHRQRKPLAQGRLVANPPGYDISTSSHNESLPRQIPGNLGEEHVHPKAELATSLTADNISVSSLESSQPSLTEGACKINVSQVDSNPLRSFAQDDFYISPKSQHEPSAQESRAVPNADSTREKPDFARTLFKASTEEVSVSDDMKQDAELLDKASRARTVVTDNSANITSVDCPSSVKKDTKKKKKKAPRIVASRFMQSAAAVTSHSSSLHQSRGPMRATDRSILKDSSGATKRTQPTVLAPKRTGGATIRKTPVTTAHKTVGPTHKSVGSAHKAVSSARKANSSSHKAVGSAHKAVGSAHKASGSGPVSENPASQESDQNAASKSSRPKAASTPELTGHSPHALGADISAIDSHHPHMSHSGQTSYISHLSSPSISEKSKSLHRGRTPMKALKYNESTTAATAKGHAGGYTQQQLDILYARYLQMVYLDAKAKHDFRKQEKQAMAQLYEAEQENDRLRKHVAELQRQKAKLKHLNALDSALQTQSSGLSSVVHELEQLSNKHLLLASALDTTRHQLNTKGVYIPDNEEEFHENLQSALLESERLLGEVSVMTRQKSSAVAHFAQALSCMDDAVSNQVSHMERCGELMSLANSLTTQECSLKIQDMQLHNGP